MTFRLTCGDVMPGCAARFENVDRERCSTGSRSTPAEVHGVTEVTPEILQAIDGNIVAD